MTDHKNKLAISHVTLKNFRAYAGQIEFDLSLDPQKTITIIHGEMGLGKTTILDSIYWCLYGKERSKKGDMATEEGIVNTNVLEDLQIGGKNETSVEILLHDEEGVRYKIKRTIQFSKDVDSVDRVSNKSIGGTVPSGITFLALIEFHYLHPQGGSSDWQIFTKPDKVHDEIEKIFPEVLSSYFLFDAELLNEFFYTEADEHVKNGIEKISGLPILDDARDHLKNTARQIERLVADKEVSTKPLADDMEKMESAINEYKEQREQTNLRLEEIKQEKKAIQEYLRQHDDLEINNLQNQMDSLEETLVQLTSANKQNTERIEEFLLYYTPRMLLRNTLSITESKFQEWEKQGKIPLAVSKIALQNILNSNPPTCICGTILDEGTPNREKIDSLMSRVVDSSLIQHITVGRSLLSNVLSTTEFVKLGKELAEIKASRGQFNKLHSEKKSARDAIQKKLNNHDLEEVQNKTKVLHSLEQEEIRLYGDRKTFEERIDFGENELRTLKRKFDAMTGKSNKYQSEQNKARMARALSSILEQCRKELVDQLRILTAEKTTKYFLNLVSKKSDFSKVEIRSNYQTLALDNNEKIKSLSAGQSCCLALSYIAAIREIANRDYFMIIDSPLHNISQEERVEIAQSLPRFIPGTQITLLVQDQEYTGHAQKKITGQEIPSVRDTLLKNKSVWREYLLEASKNKNDAVSNTSIREVKGDETI